MVVRVARWPFDGWRLATLALAGLSVLPLAAVLGFAAEQTGEVWAHLLRYVLPGVLLNTTLVALGVGLAAAMLGTVLAWFTAVYEFPGRRFFAWGLMLPLALPAYVLAFALVGLFDYAAPLQTLWREWFGAEAALPAPKARAGVVFVLSLALYPYVYLLARNAFLTQGAAMLEAAQSLGVSRARGFFLIALPMARPWIAAGVLLVLMETLADFGTVAVLNVDTFTTGIYKAWFALFSLPAAAQLAALLLTFVLALVLLEAFTRKRRRFDQPHARRAVRIKATPAQGLAMSLFASLVLAVAFALPLGQLLVWVADTGATDLDARYWAFLRNSVVLALLAAGVTVVCAMVLAYARRQHRDSASELLTRIATLGYAVPGPVLALGLFVPVVALDRHLGAWFGQPGGQILQGSLLVMLLAYLVRFLAAGFGPVEGALARVTPHIDDAARGLGLTRLKVATRVHVPLVRSGLVAAGALVFVDVMKEMPITLMTRPFGWDTLAIQIFELTSEGEWQRAALPALALVAVGLVSIVVLTRHTEKRA